MEAGTCLNTARFDPPRMAKAGTEVVVGRKGGGQEVCAVDDALVALLHFPGSSHCADGSELSEKLCVSRRADGKIKILPCGHKCGTYCKVLELFFYLIRGA